MSKLYSKPNVVLGKTPKTKFKESKSITVLKSWLEEYDNIKVRTNEEDTIPNLDGSVVILDNDYTDRITIDVQVKTLPKEYDESSVYKYECDTKVFNVVLENVTFNPVVLMLIDIYAKKTFWIHITRDYAKLLKLKPNQNSKTITFSDKNLFICDDFRTKMDEAATNLEVVINKGENALITSNIDDDNPFYGEMQDEIDKINNLFDNELKNVKSFLFPNVWKFGIAYNKYVDGSSQLGVYRIFKGKKGELIKNFDFKSDEYMMWSYNGSRYCKSIKEQLSSWLGDIMNSFFNLKPLAPIYLHEDVLYEIVFNFLDRLSYDLSFMSQENNKGVYYKDEENLETVIRYVLGLKSFYYQLVTKKDKEYPMVKMLSPYYNGTGKFLIFNPFIQPNDEEKELLLLSSIKKPTDFPPTILLSGSSDVNFELLESAILELKKRKIVKIKRLWECQNWDIFMEERKNSGKSVFEMSKARGYDNKSLYSNLDKMFSILNDSLNFTYEKLNLTDDYKLKGEYLLIYDSELPYKYNLFIKESTVFKFESCNKNLLEKSKEIEESKFYDSVICGSIDDVFGIKLPLYTYVRLLSNKGIAQSMGFNLKYDKDVNQEYQIKSLPIINDFK